MEAHVLNRMAVFNLNDVLFFRSKFFSKIVNDKTENKNILKQTKLKQWHCNNLIVIICDMKKTWV
jgi:hypothetical protein